MTPEGAVGRRVAELRERKGLTQAQLGERLGELLIKPWSRQVVWSAEHGQRALTAVELVALALVLDVHIGQLFAGPTMALDFPSGVRLTLVGPRVVPPLDPCSLASELREMAIELRQRSNDGLASASELEQVAERLTGAPRP